MWSSNRGNAYHGKLALGEVRCKVTTIEAALQYINKIDLPPRCLAYHAVSYEMDSSAGINF
jgi:hypothetical protein